VPEGRPSEDTRKFMAGQIDLFAEVVKKSNLVRE
jgi:hypothetical protein